MDAFKSSAKGTAYTLFVYNGVIDTRLSGQRSIPCMRTHPRLSSEIPQVHRTGNNDEIRGWFVERSIERSNLSLRIRNACSWEFFSLEDFEQ